MATVLTNVGRGLITALLAASNLKYVGWGTGTTEAAATDTGLQTPAAEARVGTNNGAQATTSVANDTYRVIQTLTCEGASKTISEAALFDAATGGNCGIRGVFTGKSLDVGDSIQFTFNLQFT